MGDDLVERLRNLTCNSYDAEVIEAAKDAMNTAADRIEQLERLLEQRDAFIVKNDLWYDFVATLKEKKDAD
jgi:hypothetical protein